VIVPSALMEVGIVLADPGGSNIVNEGLALAGWVEAAATNAAQSASVARPGNRPALNGFCTMILPPNADTTCPASRGASWGKRWIYQ
jgi:hypothetical protein